MVAGDLANHAAADQVQARIADMPDRNVFVLHEREGENAGHSVELGMEPGLLVNTMIRRGNGGANALFRRARGATRRTDGLADRFYRELGSALPGSASAHTIHHQVRAQLLIDPVPILVLFAEKARVRSSSIEPRP